MDQTTLEDEVLKRSQSPLYNPQLQAEVAQPDTQALDDMGLPAPAAPVSPLAAGFPEPTLDYVTRNDVAYDENYYNDQNIKHTEAGTVAGWDALSGFGNAVGRSFNNGGNTLVNIGKEIYRKSTYPADPAWTNESATTWLETAKVDPEQRWRFYGANSQLEATALLNDMRQDQRAMEINQMRGGFDAFIAGAIAGLVDVDAPLTMMSGGLSTAAKIGINGTKMGRMMASTMAGTAMGVSVGTIDYAVNPNARSEDVVLAAAMGAGFGAFGGVFSSPANRQQQAHMQRSLIEEQGEYAAYGYTGERGQINYKGDPDGPDAGPDGNDPLTGGGNSTAGARQAPGAAVYDGVGYGGMKDGPTKDRTLDDIAWAQRNPELFDWSDPTGWMRSGAGEAAVRAALRFRDAMNKVGITSDFDRLMRSNLPGAQRLAIDTLESPSGVARAQTNAATMKEAFHTDLRGHFVPYDQEFKKYYAEEQGFKFYSHIVDAPGTGSWKARQNFDQDIIRELMWMRNGKTGQRASSPAARRAALAVDAFWKKEYEIGKGNGKGDIPLDGYDKFPWETGYVPQNASGRKFAELMDEARRLGGRKGVDNMRMRIIAHFDAEYMRQAPATDPRIRKAMATALVDRALASRRGLNYDLLSLLSGDEAEFIRAAMRRNGVKDSEINTVIESIKGSRRSKTQEGQTKSRNDIDFRATDAGGLSFMDLMETDLTFLMGKRAHRTSGLAALARQGIPSKVAFEDIKAAILAQQDARGEKLQRPNRDKMDAVDDTLDADEKITPEYLDAIYSYFSGNRPGAGAAGDDVIQRIRGVAQLSLMNQLGLTSTAEYGAIAGTIGWRRFMDHAGDSFRKALGDPESALVQELKDFHIFVPEEVMFNGRLMGDLDRAAQRGMGSQFDAFLNKGKELQGWWSGFYAVRSNQQKIAMAGTTSKLFEGFKNGADGFNAQRLKDIGIDAAFMGRVMNHAIFEGNKLKSLDMQNWLPEDVHLYRQVMARVANQLIQKAMAGESNWAWSSSGIAQLMLQFKSFPLISVNKQFVRSARMADKEAMQVALFGLAFGGAASAARSLINGRTEDLTAEKIARGAINYGNLTGWLSMVVDPVMGSLGADVSVSGYSSRGVGSIVPIPAGLSVMDRLAGYPGAVIDSLDGHTSNANIRVMQSTPVLGNAYGISGILNASKDQPRPAAPKPEPVSKPKPVPPAESPALQELVELAKSKGWADGAGYVTSNTDAGMTLDQIREGLLGQ